jgi:hypothetical protein
MNKRILVLTMTIFTLVVVTLPMIPTAQAVKGGIPTENYDDVKIWGFLLPVEDATDVYVRGNVQYGRYTARSFTSMIGGVEWIAIFWDGVPMVDAQSLMGTATYDIDYKVNLNTMHGVARLKTVISVPGGTFEGDMFWSGELTFRSDFANTLNTVGVVWRNILRGTGAYDGWKIGMTVNAIPYMHGAQDAWVMSCHLIKPQTIA